MRLFFPFIPILRKWGGYFFFSPYPSFRKAEGGRRVVLMKSKWNRNESRWAETSCNLAADQWGEMFACWASECDKCPVKSGKATAPQFRNLKNADEARDWRDWEDSFGIQWETSVLFFLVCCVNSLSNEPISIFNFSWNRHKLFLLLFGNREGQYPSPLLQTAKL